jgi:hypothetical protein
MPLPFKYLSEERTYKRYADNGVVKARLIEGTEKTIKGRKLMRIVHPPTSETRCPDCGSIWSINEDTAKSKVTFLEVKIFHERHKPYRKPKPRDPEDDY